MFRIGHIGYYDVLDITTVLAAVEVLLVERGADVERGVAVARALDAYRDTARVVRDAAYRASGCAICRAPERPAQTPETPILRHHSSDGTAEVLVREQIAAPGLELLRDRFDVVEDFDSDLASIIGDFDAIVIRSATTLDASAHRAG